MLESVKHLIEGNERWIAEMQERDPNFFVELSKGQHPEHLWIGCSDSRVPACEITGQQPGAMFVHRNIANLVVATDTNLMSVINYAVKVLKVKHIIVCGHYGCGGVAAAMDNDSHGVLDKWLTNIKHIYMQNQKELEAIQDYNERLNHLVELNVKAQVLNVARVAFVQEEWTRGQYPYIHGWVYCLSDGRIRDLGVTVNSNEAIPPIYRYGTF